MAAEIGPKSSASFLVNNALKHSLNDGWFFVTPMERVKELENQYGDFMHCGSQGASAGQSSLCSLILFTSDPAVKNKINEVIKHHFESPVIEIKGSKLDIKEFTNKDEEYGAEQFSQTK